MKKGKSQVDSGNGIPVDGLDAGVSWVDYDPADWRNHPEPEGQDDENDEDAPVPRHVFAITGIDPDKEGW